MNPELLQEIQTELNRLFQGVQSARDERQDQNSIEQRTNLFEIEWQERLTIEQRAELNGARIGVEQAFEERDRQARNQADTRDAQQLGSMTPEDQVAYWQSNRTGDGILQERQRAQETSQALAQATQIINREYNQLRHDLVRAIQDVERGRQPNLSQMMQQQLDREAAAERKGQTPATQIDPASTALAQASPGQKAPETWADYKARRAQEERTQEQSQREQERLQQERERERERELKRER